MMEHVDNTPPPERPPPAGTLPAGETLPEIPSTHSSTADVTQLEETSLDGASAPDMGPHLVAELEIPSRERLVHCQDIATGGMGAVTMVEDRSLLRIQAKKTIHEKARQNQRSQRMFVREARITGQLDHPNVTPVHELGVDSDGHLFFTMKLVEGKTFREMIKDLPEGPPPHNQLLNLIEVVIKVCNALAFAHSRGVIHCDVKPSNVMVGNFGQVYLMDWGVAHLMPEEKLPPRHVRISDGPISEPAATVLGTPSQMSPEQALGNHEAIDCRSDIFLVGALLYEVLARRPPYRGATMIHTILLAASGHFKPPDEVGGVLVPQELSRIVLKAMAANQDDRYQTVNELRDDLVRFSRGGGELPRVTFAKGATVIREGETGDDAYFILTGKCEVTIGEGSQRRVMRTMGPGEAFGETAILSPGPRTATVTAIEDTTVEVVNSALLQLELDSMKPWMAMFVHTLADRFREREG